MADGSGATPRKPVSVAGRPDNLVAAAAKSISALTLQEPDVSSSASGEVQSTTQTLQEPDDVSSSGEVQSTTTSREELVAPSAQMVPRNTTDCTSPICYSASSGPTIYYRRPRDWYFMFFIRMDRGGSFHMYPDLGGPFQSLEEVDAAIAPHLDKLKRQAMCNEQDDISFVERLVRRCVFYPDGTPKKGPNSLQRKDPNFRERHFIQAIIDQCNDYHSVTEGFAHELIGDVKSLWISEGTRNYYHFNFTTRVKEAGDVYGCACNLFFAEAMQMEDDGDWVVSCCCMIGPNDNGPCYSCFRERPSMKHPENSDVYMASSMDEYMEFGDDPLSESDDDEETQLAKLRKKFNAGVVIVYSVRRKQKV